MILFCRRSVYPWLLVAGVWALGASGSCFALSVLLPIEELVQSSDVIVVATLTDVERRCNGSLDVCTGTLTVRDVVWGTTKPGRKLRLSWVNYLAGCGSSDLGYAAGVPKIWMLREVQGGVVWANTSGGVRDLGDLADVERILREFPVVVLKSRKSVRAGSWNDRTVELTVRNATTGTLSFPRMELDPAGGFLVADPGTSVTIFDFATSGPFVVRQPVCPASSKKGFTRLDRTKLQPGEQFRLFLDVGQVCPTSGGTGVYVQWSIPGWPASNERYVPPITSAAPADDLPEGNVLRRAYNIMTVSRR